MTAPGDLPAPPRRPRRPTWRGVLAVVSASALLVTTAAAVDAHRRVDRVEEHLALQQAQPPRVIPDVRLRARVDALVGEVARLHEAARGPLAPALERAAASVFSVESPTGLASGFVWRRTGAEALLLVPAVALGDLTGGGRVHLVQGDRRWRARVVAHEHEAVFALLAAAVDAPALVPAGVPAVGAPATVVSAPFGVRGVTQTGVVTRVEGAVDLSVDVGSASQGGPALDRLGRVFGIVMVKGADGTVGRSRVVPLEQVCAELPRACAP